MTDPAGSELESVLVRAAARGDAVAWRQLLETHSERVAGYVRWRCAGLPDLVADAIQQTWLEAAQNLHRYQPARGRFADWMGGIVRRVILAEVRKWRKRRVRFRSLDGQPEPLAKSNSRDEAEEVVRALAALPEDYEAVLRAKYLDGMSVEAIAEAAGETAKAVESRLSRAREAFRKAYGDKK